jgi:hypothetical protein
MDNYTTPIRIRSIECPNAPKRLTVRRNRIITAIPLDLELRPPGAPKKVRRRLNIEDYGSGRKLDFI